MSTIWPPGMTPPGATSKYELVYVVGDGWKDPEVVQLCPIHIQPHVSINLGGDREGKLKCFETDEPIGRHERYMPHFDWKIDWLRRSIAHESDRRQQPIP